MKKGKESSGNEENTDVNKDGDKKAAQDKEKGEQFKFGPMKYLNLCDLILLKRLCSVLRG